MNFKFTDDKYNLFIICGVVLAVFGNTLINGFVYDDGPMILADPVIQEFKLRDIFFSLANGIEYTPLVTLFLAVEYAAWGRNPFGYHLVNLALYLVTTLLVYRLTPKLLHVISKDSYTPEETLRIALATTLMFAVHPFHTEVAAWISANNILLSGILFLLSCSFYLDWLSGDRKLSSRAFFTSLLFFFLAASAKATVIVLPLLFLFFIVFYEERKTVVSFLHLLPFFIVSVLFFFIHKSVAIRGGRINEDTLVFGASNIISKLTIAVQIPFFYLKKFFLPFGLNIEYGDDLFSPLSNFPVIASIVAICAIASFAFATRRKHPEILFGFGWVIITMATVLNFFSTIPIVADRYFYLPLFAPVFIIAVITGKSSRTMYAICGFLCIFWASTTVMQNSTWKSNETLWGHALKSSGTAMSYLGFSEILISQGKFEKALDAVSGIKDARERKGINTYISGTILNKRGDFAGALSVLESSYPQSNGSSHFLFLLADTYEKAGKTELAIKTYNETILKSKGFTYYTLGKSSREALDRLTNNKSSLVEVLRSDIAEHPTDNKKINMLAMELDHLGFYDEALTNYLKLEHNGEKNWQLFFNIASAYKKTHKYDKALIYYDKSLILNPDYIDTINNIGVVYEKLGRSDKAIYYYNLAISKEPKFDLAPFNLALLYFNTGDRERSLKLFNYTIQNFPHLREKAEPYLQKMQ